MTGLLLFPPAPVPYGAMTAPLVSGGEVSRSLKVLLLTLLTLLVLTAVFSWGWFLLSNLVTLMQPFLGKARAANATLTVGRMVIPLS